MQTLIDNVQQRAEGIVGFLAGLAFCFLLVAVYALVMWIRLLLSRRARPVPERIDYTKLGNENLVLEHMREEWKVTVETQMHFNDLIIRFRALILTVVGSMAAALVAISKLMGDPEKMGGAIQPRYFAMGLCFLGAIWFSAFLLDTFYYRHLLLGSVKHAEKFDDSNFARDFGFFGLTKRITTEMPRWISVILIVLFYLLPFVVVTSFFMTEIVSTVERFFHWAL